MPGGRPSRRAVYAKLDDAVGELNERFGGLPLPAEAADIWSDLWHLEAHHSTAIEGNTLMMSEVRRLLDEGRAVGSKELKEYMEVLGYAEAAQWVYQHALDPGDWTDGTLVTLHEVRELHYRAMRHVWEVAGIPNATAAESPGNWRAHQIATFPGGMKPPPFTEVEPRMRTWVDSVHRLAEPSEIPSPERLAEVHHQFEAIHPFLDGNGRVGRLLLNLVLIRLGYPPAIVYKGERRVYLDALIRADKGDFGPLGELIARSVTGNLYRFVLPAVAGPARLVPLVSVARPDAGLSANALRVAATRGRLRAQKQPDGTWLSSKNWVDEYAASRYRRGDGPPR